MPHALGRRGPAAGRQRSWLALAGAGGVVTLMAVSPAYGDVILLESTLAPTAAGAAASARVRAWRTDGGATTPAGWQARPLEPAAELPCCSAEQESCCKVEERIARQRPRRVREVATVAVGDLPLVDAEAGESDFASQLTDDDGKPAIAPFEPEEDLLVLRPPGMAGLGRPSQGRGLLQRFHRDPALSSFGYALGIGFDSLEEQVPFEWHSTDENANGSLWYRYASGLLDQTSGQVHLDRRWSVHAKPLVGGWAYGFRVAIGEVAGSTLCDRAGPQDLGTDGSGELAGFLIPSGVGSQPFQCVLLRSDQLGASSFEGHARRTAAHSWRAAGATPPRDFDGIVALSSWRDGTRALVTVALIEPPT